MASTRRLAGLAGGNALPDTHELMFDLAVMNGQKPLSFIASYGVASQIIGALADMLKPLTDALAQAKGMVLISGEEVGSLHVQKERWEDVVILRLTTPEGIPHAFRMSPQTAVDIADRLKTESAKPTEAGNA